MNPISHYIDHAVLKPEMNCDDASTAIKLGVEHETRTVCVRPCDIELAQSLCQGTTTEVSTVLAFPHGVSRKETKAAEAEAFVRLGVAEVDMAANNGFIKSRDWSAFEADIEGVFDVLSASDIPLKVILETAALEIDEIAEATRRCASMGVAFVKTSTGFGPGGATVESVQTMLEAARGQTEVKASGGIRNFDDAQRFIEMGCTRLGVGYNTTPILAEGGTQSSKEAY